MQHVRFSLQSLAFIHAVEATWKKKTRSPFLTCRLTMRVVLLLLVVIALGCFVAPAEAYRKRKGADYKTPFWTKPKEEDLKIEVLVRASRLDFLISVC